MTPADIEARSIPEPNTGCWLWLGGVDRKGYGKKHGKLAHRLSFAAHGGELIAGLTIDHLCRLPCCVNPAHLEQVTGRENTRRAFAARAGQSRSENDPPVCGLSDHRAGKNIYVSPEGWKFCRACRRFAAVKYKSKMRALRLAQKG